MAQRAHDLPPAADLTEELVGARLDGVADLPRTVFLLRHVDGLEVMANGVRPNCWVGLGVLRVGRLNGLWRLRMMRTDAGAPVCGHKRDKPQVYLPLLAVFLAGHPHAPGLPPRVPLLSTGARGLVASCHIANAAIPAPLWLSASSSAADRDIEGLRQL